MAEALDGFAQAIGCAELLVGDPQEHQGIGGISAGELNGLVQLGDSLGGVVMLDQKNSKALAIRRGVGVLPDGFGNREQSSPLRSERHIRVE